MQYLDYNEKKQHGTPDFPIEYYHVDERHPRYNMLFHWHRELEIIRVLEGVLYLKLDDEEINVMPGGIVFINEGVIHGAMPQNCVYECIVFDIRHLLMHTDACKSYIRRITRHEILIQNQLTETDCHLRQAVDYLFTSMEQKAPGNELITIGALFGLFGLVFQDKLYQNVENDKKPSMKMMQLKPVLEYIDDNYSKSITLNDLSRIAGMSPKYFCRYFHSVIHRTPIDYLNYYRIERACGVLSSCDLAVSEVAYRCGFTDVCYFIKIFRKYKGITPRRYCISMV